MAYSYIVVAKKDLETDKKNHTKGNKKHITSNKHRHMHQEKNKLQWQMNPFKP